MMIIGCDFHPRFQQVSFLLEETGECGQRRLMHTAGAVEYYRSLSGTTVRVGIDARTALVGLHSLESLQAVLPLANLFHQLFVVSRAFDPALRRGRFGPFARSIGASLLPSSPKASRSWLFCRLPLIESRRLLAASFRLGLRRSRGYYARC